MEGQRAYLIVQALSANILESRVNQEIESGYKPIGGVACVKEECVTYFYQSMIQQ